MGGNTVLEHVEQMLDESTGADCEARGRRGKATLFTF